MPSEIDSRPYITTFATNLQFLKKELWEQKAPLCATGYSPFRLFRSVDRINGNACVQLPEEWAQFCSVPSVMRTSIH
jgi:hypothetical protein